MVDPRHAPDDADRSERDDSELEVEREILKDLTVPSEDADDVRGGATTGGNVCQTGTW
jgi:hypothetical protein